MPRSTLLMLALIAAGPAASHPADGYEWQTSTSPTDVCVYVSASEESPYVTLAEPWTGYRSLYFWTTGCISSSSGSEFSLFGTLEVSALIPRNGTVNLGTTTSPILRYGDCVDDRLVAEIIVRDRLGLGGNVCLGPSVQNGVNGSQECSPKYSPHLWVGFTSDPSEQCFGPVPVSPSTWGSVKAGYR